MNDYPPLTLTPKAAPPKLVTLTGPLGRWSAQHGDVDADPRDSGEKLRFVLIPN